MDRRQFNKILDRLLGLIYLIVFVFAIIALLVGCQSKSSEQTKRHNIELLKPKLLYVSPAPTKDKLYEVRTSGNYPVYFVENHYGEIVALAARR